MAAPSPAVLPPSAYLNMDSTELKKLRIDSMERLGASTHVGPLPQSARATLALLDPCPRSPVSRMRRVVASCCDESNRVHRWL
jgi:hypothetical protein